MIDALASIVRDVSLDVASRIVERARYERISARSHEARDRRTNDEIGEVAHAGTITEGCFFWVSALRKVVEAAERKARASLV